MNRLSLMTYSILTFLAISAVVLVNLWVGLQLKEPVHPVSAPVFAKPIPKEAPVKSGPRPPIIDPTSDSLAPIVVEPPVESSESVNTKNPPKKIYESPLESGDILAM